MMDLLVMEKFVSILTNAESPEDVVQANLVLIAKGRVRQNQKQLFLPEFSVLAETGTETDTGIKKIVPESAALEFYLKFLTKIFYPEFDLQFVSEILYPEFFLRIS